MFYVYYGDDRKKISEEVKKTLGEDYEVFEGEKLSCQDIMNICQGMSLFAEKRRILIRDLTPARKDESDAPGLDYYAELSKYLNTPHEIVIWETNVSRKKSFSEFKKMPSVKAQKFESVKPFGANKIFTAADLAFSDGKKAVELLSEYEDENDPYMFVGLLVSKLSDKYERTKGKREKQALLELSELDMLMKTSKIDPWALVKGFIMRFQNI